MDSLTMDHRNGASWIRDCLLGSPDLAQASDRMQAGCREGRRHFSALGRAVPLEQAQETEIEISRLEDEGDAELSFRSEAWKPTQSVARPGSRPARRRRE